MLLCFVYLESHPRRSPNSMPSLIVTSLRPYFSSSKSFPVISFANPHHLNSVVSYRYKITGGGGWASNLPFTILRSQHPSKSLPVNPFADPHPLNLYATVLYKNMGDAPSTAEFASQKGAPPCPSHLIISPLQGIIGTTNAEGCALS